MGFTTRVKSEASEKKPFNFALFWDKYGTFFILAIIVAIFGSLSPEYFLTTNNITQIFVQSSVTVLIGMGEFFAILVAGIDLSVGAILALSGMVTAKLMLAGVDPFLAAMIGGVLVGGALGAINGCLVNWTGLHPFIITLGTNAIFRGITLVISDANSVYGFSFDFVNFFAASVIGIPVPVIFSLIVALILWFLTTRMRLGRNIYALGGNKNSAFYSGIDVKFHILVVFIISGVCAGLAGVVSTARLGAAEPLAGMGFETYAIASAIIGGTSFFGGKGRIFSVVIGGLIIGTINNGLNILQVQTYYQLVVMGGEWKMSMGDEVGYGAGIAPHPNGEREKTSAIFNIEHNRSPRPSGERVRVRGPARTFPLITPPQSPSHQTPPQTLTVVRFPSATHQTGG